jgi:hypothetical protein
MRLHVTGSKSKETERGRDLSKVLRMWVWFGFENGLTIWCPVGWESRIRCVCEEMGGRQRVAAFCCSGLLVNSNFFWV